MQLYTADWVHFGGTFQADGALLVDDEGRVSAVGSRLQVAQLPAAAGALLTEFPGRAVAPGTISAHSHSFQVFLRGPGDHPRSFRDWVNSYLYPLVERLDLESLEAAALLCFAQMARAGVTSVGEFHYLHNAPGDNAPQSEELAQTVIGAARRIGLRVAFLRTIYDVKKHSGQGRFAESAPDAIQHTRALAASFAADPHVHVMPAPHSLHGATEGAIRGAAELALELGTPWHIHLAEQEEDVEFARGLHGDTPLRVLEQWGVLDSSTVLVHGIWLDEGERELLATRGAGLVTNPTTNMALGDGIARLTELVERGVPVALGTDMNGTTNIFLEMRTAEMLQRVQSLRMGRLAAAGRADPDPEQILAMGTERGARLLALETGCLEAGRWADFITLDLSDPSLLPAAVLGGRALTSALTTAMVAETAVRDSFVAGQQILRSGQLLGISQDDLAARVNSAPVFRAGQ